MNSVQNNETSRQQGGGDAEAGARSGARALSPPRFRADDDAAIAERAGLSLGAAYHYFKSKDAILIAYYEWTQDEHERLAERAAPPGSGLRAQVLALFETKLAVVRKDRRLLAAIFARLGDAADPLSVFGRKNAALRERSILQFTTALSELPLSQELKKLAGRSLWLSHLAVLMFFIHDRSPRQVKTHALIGAIADLAVALPLLAHPHAAMVRERLLTLSADLGPSLGVAS